MEDFFLCRFPHFYAGLSNSVALPLQSSLLDHNEPFPVFSSVVFSAEMWTPISQSHLYMMLCIPKHSLHISLEKVLLPLV